MAERLLDVHGLDVAYGPATAVRTATLHVDEGEIVALLGANGAGKTSTLRGISGVVRPARGRVSFAGRRMEGASPARIVKAGLAHVPEGRRVFPGLTVDDNLELGGWHVIGTAATAAQRDLVFGVFPRLAERRSQLAGSLSGGEQQMLAIGRALMSRPRLLMIDELSLGLAPVLVDELMERLPELRDRGLSLLLVEQFVHRALELADRVYVLQKGQIAYSGRASEVSASVVGAAYLTEVLR
ncbi:MAG TPA: ABC transporter ATP-binding protein [Acidimicrobiia bacterium]|nr:ABC transporter ATP-binding protein [Acidimicrobiia bacterium]